MAEDVSFEGQVAIVTGAGGGLGRSYALELARRGARVVVNDFGGNTDGTGGMHAPADDTVGQIQALGGEAVASYASVATPDGGASIVELATGTFGTVDIVINNAGILRDRAFVNLAPADLEALLDVHLAGAFNVTRPAFSVMKEKGYGRLLFTSSASGLYGNFGQSNYAAAKMGVVGLSNVLAIEGARYQIQSNVIAPAAASRLTAGLLGPLAGALSPDLVTPLALYLVSKECESTHEIFTAGGGRFARVFIGMCEGWTSDAPAISLEDIRSHLGEIRDLTKHVVPSSSAEEMEILASFAK